MKKTIFFLSLLFVVGELFFACLGIKNFKDFSVEKSQIGIEAKKSLEISNLAVLSAVIMKNSGIDTGKFDVPAKVAGAELPRNFGMEKYIDAPYQYQSEVSPAQAGFEKMLAKVIEAQVKLVRTSKSSYIRVVTSDNSRNELMALAVAEHSHFGNYGLSANKHMDGFSEKIAIKGLVAFVDEISPCWARGLSQFTYGTYKFIQKKHLEAELINSFIVGTRNPDNEVIAMLLLINHIKEVKKTIKNPSVWIDDPDFDIDFTAAMYNCGAVLKLIKNRGRNWRSGLPVETQRYMRGTREIFKEIIRRQNRTALVSLNVSFLLGHLDFKSLKAPKKAGRKFMKRKAVLIPPEPKKGETKIEGVNPFLHIRGQIGSPDFIFLKSPFNTGRKSDQSEYGGPEIIIPFPSTSTKNFELQNSQGQNVKGQGVQNGGGPNVILPKDKTFEGESPSVDKK